MPKATTKPEMNKPIRVKLENNSEKPGKWDGVHWWIETQNGGPSIPLPPSFVKEWRRK